MIIENAEDKEEQSIDISKSSNSIDSEQPGCSWMTTNENEDWMDSAIDNNFNQFDTFTDIGTESNTDPLFIDEHDERNAGSNDGVDEPMLKHSVIPTVTQKNVGGRPRDGIQICQICGFQTYRKHLLSKHIDSHGESKYHCQWEGCDKKYKQKKHLQEHERNSKHRKID